MKPPVDWSALLATQAVRSLIDLALAEDIGAGDVTTQAIFAAPSRARGVIFTRVPTVVCGVPLAMEIFRRVEPSLELRAVAQEGAALAPDGEILHIDGDVRSILTGERCALNFLQRLCGIAQGTALVVREVPAGTRAKIYDTRKTTPGWRVLEKAAVKTGGGENHRMGLFDAILIKDNHIAAAGSVRRAVEMARQRAPQLSVEVEIQEIGQLEEAIAAGAKIVLCDNFDTAGLAAAVRQAAGRVEIEASGGIKRERIVELARAGVDRISMGALTHTVTPADLSLDVRA